MNEDKAKTALGYYYNASIGYGIADEVGTSDDFITYIVSISPSFLTNFGNALNDATQLSSTDVQNAMTQLAQAANGNVPTSPRDLSTFFDALLGQLQGVTNWTRIIKSTASDTVTAVETGAAVVVGGAAIYGLIIAGLFLLAVSRGK